MRSRQGPGPDSTLESSRESLRNSLACSFVVTVLTDGIRQAAAVGVPWPGSPRARAFFEPHRKPPNANPVMHPRAGFTWAPHVLRVHSPLVTISQ